MPVTQLAFPTHASPAVDQSHIAVNAAFTLPGKLAGQAITAGAACFVGANNLIYMCDADATAVTGVVITPAIRFDGIALTATPSGESVTLHWGILAYPSATAYATAELLYTWTTPGQISRQLTTDTPTTGSLKIGTVLDGAKMIVRFVPVF